MTVREPGRFAFTVACLLLAICLCVIAGRMDAADEALETRHYCQMVNLYSISDGEMGWPDYRGDAAEVCRD